VEVHVFMGESSPKNPMDKDMNLITASFLTHLLIWSLVPVHSGSVQSDSLAYLNTATLKQSIAVAKSNGDVKRPIIEITTPEISVRHSPAQLTSRVLFTKLTALDGSGGEYRFTKKGRYTVAPGRYRHTVHGRMVTSSSGRGAPRSATIKSYVVYY
jgi:hypothetical protein